jgi:hypothetical protein
MTGGARPHLQRAAELMREAIGEIHVAAFRAPRRWRAELLQIQRHLLQLTAELVKALAELL